MTYKHTCITATYQEGKRRGLAHTTVIQGQEYLTKTKFELCSRCFLCGSSSESIDHLFLHCYITDQLWKLFPLWWGPKWCMPRDNWVVEVLEHQGQEQVAKEWGCTIPSCIWWYVWRGRNQRCFEDEESSIKKITSSIVFLTFYSKVEQFW